MKFSICVPNYNYEQYVGSTIDSVIHQEFTDFEIVISDNRSTDNSWELIRQYQQKEPRIKIHQNLTNLGFAGNLDIVCGMGNGEYQILLSSDDEMISGALTFYNNLLSMVGSENVVICASCNRIDSNGNIIGYDGPKKRLWMPDDLNKDLSEKFNAPIYKVPSNIMLERCLKLFYGPFNFAATCYSTYAYQKAGGYGGTRMINPDKWFHWKILSITDYVYFIDTPLFNYRWHNTNQTAQLNRTGVLKFFMDEYRSSFEIDNEFLKRTSLSIKSIPYLFIENSILKYVFLHIKNGNLQLAKRIFSFGLSTYPKVMKSHKYFYPLKILLGVGRLGIFAAKLLKNGNQKPVPLWQHSIKK